MGVDESGQVKGLGTGVQGNQDILVSAVLHTGRRYKWLPFVCKVLMDLIRNNQHAMLAADGEHGIQFFLRPYAAYRVMG